ncbi:MAG: response regulator transcription factor [Deltaproteobacteria bacterium]|nr:response regulator transcription factor [Deltaproteobacteria bacterium]
MKRVLIADDHPIVRHGLRALIDAERDFEVTVELSEGSAVLERLDAVDVAILDISLPGLSGLELLKRWPTVGPPVVMLTMHAEYVTTAFELGARGYLLKEDAGPEVVDCLRAVLTGLRYRSRRLPREAESTALLTETERAVLRLVADHKTSRQIAEALGVSLRTVQNHRANAVAKLGLRGPGALLEFALAHVHEL